MPNKVAVWKWWNTFADQNAAARLACRLLLG